MKVGPLEGMGQRGWGWGWCSDRNTALNFTALELLALITIDFTFVTCHTPLSPSVCYLPSYYKIPSKRKDAIKNNQQIKVSLPGCKLNHCNIIFFFKVQNYGSLFLPLGKKVTQVKVLQSFNYALTAANSLLLCSDRSLHLHSVSSCSVFSLTVL